jgi:hypothetical protein
MWQPLVQYDTADRDRPGPVPLVLHGAERRGPPGCPHELAVDRHGAAEEVNPVDREAEAFGDAYAAAGAEHDDGPVTGLDGPDQCRHGLGRRGTTLDRSTGGSWCPHTATRR